MHRRTFLGSVAAAVAMSAPAVAGATCIRGTFGGTGPFRGLVESFPRHGTLTIELSADTSHFMDALDALQAAIGSSGVRLNAASRLLTGGNEQDGLIDLISINGPERDELTIAITPTFKFRKMIADLAAGKYDDA